MAWFTCKVNAVGPAYDGTLTPAPDIYINLSDQAGSFDNQWFFAADNSKSQMLAVALTAVTAGAWVKVGTEPPNPGNDPFTMIERLYVLAP